MINRICNSAIVKNASWLIMGKIAQMVISLIVGLMTARYLGPANYGLINYATAYTMFFMAFCNLGINSILVKEFIEHPADEGEILGSTLVMRGISSFISAAMIVCIVTVIEADEPTTIIVTALCSIGLLFNIFESINFWFQSRLQSKVTAIVALVAYFITASYKIILLILGKSVEWFAFSTALDYMLIGFFLLLSYKVHGGHKLSFSIETSKRILRQSYHFILPNLMVSIYGYADKFMLKHMLSDSDVGYYATAVAICSMWTFVLAAMIDSMYPSIMEAHKENTILFEKRNRQLYGVVFYVSAIVSIGFCVLGSWVVGILYGEAYLPAVVPLKIVTWYTAFSYLGVARNAWIVCETKQAYLKYIYVSSAIVNIALNFVFIPIWGVTGAAVASLLTQMTTTMIVPFFIKDLRRNSILMIEAIFLKDIR